MKTALITLLFALVAVAGDKDPKSFPWHLSPSEYLSYLKELPTSPTSPDNITEAEVNQHLGKRTVCRFYATHSPSVVNGMVKIQKRVRVVSDAEDLLSECRKLKERNGPHRCTAIELAGHSTQSVGLDAIIGIDHQSRNPAPREEKMLRAIAACFHDIATPTAPVIFSTCGGDRDDDGAVRFWVKKKEAQEELAEILQRPVISGRGPVCGRGLKEAQSPEGWYIAQPNWDEPAIGLAPDSYVPPTPTH